MNFINSRDRIVVSTLRCGRNNPGSNPGHGTLLHKKSISKNEYKSHRDRKVSVLETTGVENRSLKYVSGPTRSQ